MAHHAPDYGAETRKRLFAPICPTPWRNPVLHYGPIIDLTRGDYTWIEPHVADAAMKAGRA